MPPARPRAQPQSQAQAQAQAQLEDSRSEASSTRERERILPGSTVGSVLNGGSGKNRRVAGVGSGSGSGAGSGPGGGGGVGAAGGNGGGIGSGAGLGGSNLRDVVSASAVTMGGGGAAAVGGAMGGFGGSGGREDGSGAGGGGAAEGNVGIQWSTFAPSILHGYRHDYRLSTPASFHSTYNQLILARSPIGRMSPTMAQRKEDRRQSGEQLASAARKHFNSMGIVENEVVVDFLYKVRWQDKKFRKRFAPPRPR